jgi:uncharacterized membrane protein YqjE
MDDDRTPGEDPTLQLGATLLAMARTRVELLAVDVSMEREHLVAQYRLLLVAWTAGITTGFATILWFALALPEQYRLGALGALIVLLAGFTWWTWRLRASYRVTLSRPFRRFLEQLARDSDALTGRAGGGS